MRKEWWLLIAAIVGYILYQKYHGVSTIDSGVLERATLATPTPDIPGSVGSVYTHSGAHVVGVFSAV
jgi:hypothetical protein